MDNFQSILAALIFPIIALSVGNLLYKYIFRKTYSERYALDLKRLIIEPYRATIEPYLFQGFKARNNKGKHQKYLSGKEFVALQEACLDLHVLISNNEDLEFLLPLGFLGNLRALVDINHKHDTTTTNKHLLNFSYSYLKFIRSVRSSAGINIQYFPKIADGHDVRKQKFYSSTHILTYDNIQKLLSYATAITLGLILLVHIIGITLSLLGSPDLNWVEHLINLVLPAIAFIVAFSLLNKTHHTERWFLSLFTSLVVSITTMAIIDRLNAYVYEVALKSTTLL